MIFRFMVLNHETIQLNDLRRFTWQVIINVIWIDNIVQEIKIMARLQKVWPPQANTEETADDLLFDQDEIETHHLNTPMLAMLS